MFRIDFHLVSKPLSGTSSSMACKAEAGDLGDENAAGARSGR